MTKADIVENVYENLSVVPKKEVARLVDEVFETMKDHLAEGGRLKISRFGNFVVRQKGPRPGRNPHTLEEIEIEARRVVTFRPSPALREELNPNRRKNR